MFTEMAECIGHFPMTAHMEKNLGWEMAVEEGCTKPWGSQGAGIEGSLGLSMTPDTVGTQKALRQEGSPPPWPGDTRAEWHLSVKRRGGPFRPCEQGSPFPPKGVTEV